MTVKELKEILEKLPPDAIVRMQIANKSCAYVGSVAYEFDGEQDWVLLDDYK